jgi:hypothetical protein
MPVAKIDAPLLLKVLRVIEKRTADTTHRAKTVCDRVMAYAVSTGRLTHNVSTNLKGVLTPVTKGHFAATLEPRRLGEILKLMDGYRGTPSCRG